MASILKDDLRAVRRVAIVGGTHGNERNGVGIATHLLANPDAAKRPSFETTVLLANPAAIEQNRRYVDEDLNRCFTAHKLHKLQPCPTRESKFARRLDFELGPKCDAERAVDLVIDLHNTTSDCGYALMMSRTDALSHAVCAALGPRVRCCEWADAPEHSVLPSCGRAGFTLEVGPVACGITDVETYRETLRLVHAALDFVHARNVALEAGAAPTTARLDAYRRVLSVDFPRSGEGEVAALIAPGVRDFKPIARGTPTFVGFDGSTVLETHDEPRDLVPFFVNEAAYWEKGVAYVLAETVGVEVEVVGGKA